MKTLKNLIEKSQDVEVVIAALQSGRFSEHKELFAYLESQGLKVEQTGKGHFSTVFKAAGRRPDWVLKTTWVDEGYDAFLPMAKDFSPSNPLFPKVRGPYRLGKFSCVFVEHLNSTHPILSEIEGRVKKVIKALDKGDPEEKVYKSILKLDGRNPNRLYADFTTKVFKHALPIWYEGKGGREEYGRLFEGLSREFFFKMEHLESFMRIVYGHGPRGWDLKSENMGLRKDGHLVFFDPIA
jgi:hypothetical protein